MVEELIHVKFVERRVPRDDHTSITHKSDDPAIQPVVIKEKNEELISLDDEKKLQAADDTEHLTLPRSWRFEKDHPPANILGHVDEGVRTRSRLREDINVAFMSHIEPRKVDEALLEVEWVNAMHDELEQFE